MLMNDIHPPSTGLNADPVLYGVAAGLAELFPPVAAPRPCGAALGTDADADGSGEDAGDREPIGLT